MIPQLFARHGERSRFYRASKALPLPEDCIKLINDEVSKVHSVMEIDSTTDGGYKQDSKV